MEYKNTKTGAVINSSCFVSGGDWVPYDSRLKQEAVTSNELPEIQEQPEEKETQNDEAFDKITRDQIMQELDAFGVKYDKRANKQTLYDLMMQQGE
jgi:arginyl-tRNA synthetase